MDTSNNSAVLEDLEEKHKDECAVLVGHMCRYASEFGSSVFSSFESMSPTLAPEHWGIHGGAPPDTCTGGFESK